MHSTIARAMRLGGMLVKEGTGFSPTKNASPPCGGQLQRHSTRVQCAEFSGLSPETFVFWGCALPAHPATLTAK
ncbi:hypothetical protein RMSM_01811 [Rhodopirellula maiorica SM1]|uniref:Uncharacterized protein n=1 Tax=Rhodopirellula maiorica SM1 TaxID=1265738 RepID=M5S502_9BACT|nr:hypothetical protein RMSM_01811 [Rhodopirellula maiorica SM1]